MATIENRSRFIVTVANRDDLLKTFPHSKRADAMAYVRQLSTEYGFKPKLSRGEQQLHRPLPRGGLSRSLSPMCDYFK